MLENKSTEKYINILLIANSSIILFPNNYKIYPIVFLFLFSYINYKNATLKKQFPFKKVFLISALILIYLASYFLSFQTKNAFFRLSTMASLIAYPLIFGFLDSSNFILSNKNLKNAFHAFIFSTTFFCFISFIFFWIQENYTFKITIIHYFNLINISLGKFSIHAIYLSIYIGISLLMLVYLIKNNTHRLTNLAYFVLALFLGTVLIIMMRKGPIIYLMISMFVLLYHYFDPKKTIIGLLIGVFMTTCLLNVMPKYQNENRFEELVNNALIEKPNSSIAIRYRIYTCAVEKILEKPFFGYGVGNVQNHLDPCYIEKKIDLSKKTYNCHNQFISIILTAGLFGLVIYLITIFKIYKILNKNKSIIGIAILSFFLLNFLTENVLERENGMLVYSFLLSFFLFSNQDSHKLS